MNKMLTALVGVLLAATAACGSTDTDADTSSDVGPAPEQKLVVYAAASLKDTFTEIGAQFEAENEGVTVEFNFAGSSDLVAQIQQGAPADVFASADEKNMTKATDDKLVDGDPTDFATNTLQIATPPDNPADIATLQDLTGTDVKVVLCAPEVPCGSAAVGVEEAAGIDIQPVSEEQSVTDVLNKVISGEADAGLVYVTDVIGAGDSVEGFEFPESAEVVNTYPIAPLSDSENVELAAQFVEFVTGASGQSVLSGAGFGAP